MRVVKEGQQCMYHKTRGIIRRVLPDNWYDVELIDFAMVYYEGFQLEKEVTADEGQGRASA